MKTGENLSIDQLEAELKREQHKKMIILVIKSSLYILSSVAAVVVLIAILLFPVLKIHGNSMTPTFYEGQIVIARRGSDLNTGDIVAFNYNNQVLIKRVIAKAGDWVDIREDGTVIVNGIVLDESYVSEKSFGINDLTYPYQIPDKAIFVMGDHRMTSIDSRSRDVGCISIDSIVGKIVLRIWPLNEIKLIN
ncbi:MAG: signal peptidase I [Firmicutes bacterium]|nr:signal peptidase I [Bacillota bacterium]